MLLGDRAERGARDAAPPRPSRSGRPAAAARRGRAGCAATRRPAPGPAGAAPGRRRDRAGPRGPRRQRSRSRQQRQRQREHQPSGRRRKARTWVAQPTGESQSSHRSPPPEPGRRPGRHDQVCRGEHADRDRPGRRGRSPDSWAVTAATAAKTRPHVPIASPMAAEPPAGRPMAASPAEISSASTQLAAAASSTPDGQRGAAAHRGRADELEPPGLLVGPGVPDHDEDAHQARRERGDRAVLVDGQRADRAAVQRPAQRERRSGRGRCPTAIASRDAGVL